MTSFIMCKMYPFLSHSEISSEKQTPAGVMNIEETALQDCVLTKENMFHLDPSKMGKNCKQY